jgi:predicted nucleotidyltransferase
MIANRAFAPVEPQNVIQDMVDRIVLRFNPHMIILFGSHARGDAGPDSDVDLLVVLPISGSQRAKAAEIDAALADRDLPLDLVVATPEYVARKRNIVGTIIYPAFHEGRILHERTV